MICLLNDLNDFPNKTNWASQVRDTLFNLGFNEVWYNQSVGNEAIFLFTLKQRLTDISIQNWNARLNESNRAIFYRNLNFFCYKSYLDIKSDRLRHSLSR